MIIGEYRGGRKSGRFDVASQTIQRTERSVDVAPSFKGSPRNSSDHRETIKRPSCRGNNPEVVESILRARRSCQIGKRLWANELDFSTTPLVEIEVFFDVLSQSMRRAYF